MLYVPAALALHQRPGVPGIRSTFGTGTELLNSLRLMFSRLSHHRCPNGHYPVSYTHLVCQGLYCGRPWVIIAVVVFDNCVFRQVRPDTPIIGQQGTGCNM